MPAGTSGGRVADGFLNYGVLVCLQAQAEGATECLHACGHKRRARCGGLPQGTAPRVASNRLSAAAHKHGEQGTWMISMYCESGRVFSFASIEEMMRSEARRAPTTFLYATERRLRSSRPSVLTLTATCRNSVHKSRSKPRLPHRCIACTLSALTDPHRQNDLMAAQNGLGLNARGWSSRRASSPTAGPPFPRVPLRCQGGDTA